MLLAVCAAKDDSLVKLDLFVAGKCPDAARCELTFIPEVLKTVGSIVDLRLGFIAEEAGNDIGFTCMHGEDECIGNIAQLCVQQHFPVHVSRDSHRLPKAMIWTEFLQCVGQFNHTNQSTIPHNTASCLSQLGVPMAVSDSIRTCVAGKEGKALMSASVNRTLAICGHHSEEPGKGCKSCSMFLDQKPACVVDGGTWYNCSIGTSPDEWVRKICTIYQAKKRSPTSPPVPTICNIPATNMPKIYGHSYASTDAEASARFAVEYFGATIIHDELPAEPACAATGAREVTVRMPSFDDFRGGGLYFSFVTNPLKPGGSYNISQHVKALTLLYGNLSDNQHHDWNQYFDNHLGFYITDMAALPQKLMETKVG
jgi:hypothetical protein